MLLPIRIGSLHVRRVRVLATGCALRVVEIYCVAAAKVEAR